MVGSPCHVNQTARRRAGECRCHVMLLFCTIIQRCGGSPKRTISMHGIYPMNRNWPGMPMRGQEPDMRTGEIKGKPHEPELVIAHITGMYLA